jgi:hypothetical protein
MNPPLTDDVWKRKGISVLWDVPGLFSLGSLTTAISLREFFLWDADGWREDSAHARFSGGDRRIVVAGLEAALDCMEPEQAGEWMSELLLPAIHRCAEILFQGGTGGALLFWMVKHERFRMKLANDEIMWGCDGEHRGSEILFSHGLWNGAYRDVQRIALPNSEPEPGLGFYLQRIS